MSAARLWISLLFVLALGSSAWAEEKASAPQSAVSSAVDTLVPVTPDDRANEDMLYWHLTAELYHGAIIKPADGPSRLLTVDFSAFPLGLDHPQSGAIRVRQFQPTKKDDPPLTWASKKSLRTISKALLDRLQTVWDAALKTAKPREKPDAAHEGTQYELRGSLGLGSGSIVVEARAPHSGVPRAVVKLVEAMIAYAGIGDIPAAKDASALEAALGELEKALK